MPRRFVVPEDRQVFAAIGSWSMVEGTLHLLDATANRRLWLADLWPVMLVVAGAMTLAFLFGGMRSFPLRAWASALQTTSCAGRGAALTLGIVRHTTPSLAAGLSGLALWWFTAFLLYITWRARVPVGTVDARASTDS